MSPSSQPAPEIAANVEIWDDDMFAAAFEGAADDLLEEYARSPAEQAARDEIAGRIVALVNSASETSFSDEARQFGLIDQLISRLGSLCDHSHVQEMLADHIASRSHFHPHAESAEEEAEEDETESAKPKNWFSLANHTGALITPLFDGLKKYLPTPATNSQGVSKPLIY